MSRTQSDSVLHQVEAAADEMVSFAADLVRVPTVNPPGENYDDCARLLGDRLRELDFEVEYLVANDRPEHSERYPRTNVVGTRAGSGVHPLVHLNGHIDVVPAGAGWTRDPFAGEVEDGKLYGRGAADMKGGLAAALYAAESLRRAGVEHSGSIEVSGTVDEESGGFAGVAHLAEIGRIGANRTDHVIIPEPLDVDRICLGHRGVYWFQITTFGQIAHGSMPFLGTSAIDAMAQVLGAFSNELVPRIAQRTTEMPVVPEAARHPTLNINSVQGGQPSDGLQTPCVADRCQAILDRRFLIEESVEDARNEARQLIERTLLGNPGWRYELEDLMVVEPVLTPPSLPLVTGLGRAIESVLHKEAQLIASPGTYDHKHVTRIGGIQSCVAYGPGILEQAHQPDEWCAVEDMVNAAKVIALTLVELLN